MTAHSHGSIATASVARFIANTRYRDLPPELIEMGKKHILDGLGVALAGAKTEVAKLTRAYVMSQGGDPSATVIASGEKVSTRFAALANAVAMHADDFDDTNQPTGGAAKTGGVHTTTVILPTILAFAEARKLSGQDVTTAFHVGTEIACKVNDAIFARHYEAGFHSTGTVGTLGAAATTANAYRFPEDRVAVALGIAASQAGGLRENFGTMIKPFHAGRAAESGILTADLVALGASASQTIFDAERGFFGAFANGFDPVILEQRLGNPWAILDPGSLIKPYPSGALSHPAMTLLEDLIAEHGIRGDQVRKLTVTTQPKFKAILIHPRPRDGLEAKFSLPYNLAAILVYGRAGTPEFEDEAVRAPAVKEMLSRIAHEAYEPQPDYGNLTAFMKIELEDGRVIEGRVDFAKGSPKRPMTLDDIIVKFRACAEAGGIPESRAESIIDLVLRLDKLEDVCRLTAALR